jgi:predicted nucleic acid-binding protein
MAIASCLVDTNILLRASRKTDPQYKIVSDALMWLVEQGTILFYTFQNIAECWNAMTRPIARNGLGLTANEAEQEVAAIEAGMRLLSDSDAVYREWRQIVVRHKVFGVQVHDARLAATMYVHGVRYILTLNVADFSRFRGITALHPADVKSFN